MDDARALDPDGLLERLVSSYPEGAARSEDARIVRAPGRVNLIGEHTDYNEGFVLPVAIDLEVRLATLSGQGSRVRVTRADDGGDVTFDLSPLPRPSGRWHDYVVGMAWSMTEAGLPTSAFDGLVASTLPIGAGLSSSAALELASAWALAGPDGPTVPPLELARLAQRAENDFVGVRCGLMDQFASACGVAGHALLLDCRSLEWRPVALPDDLALVVTHSGVAHAHGDNEYNERRAACERAVAVIAREAPQVTSLRDVDMAMLQVSRAKLDAVTFDRAHHVITENQRVLDAVGALEAGDHASLGELMAASQASMRDRYQISCPEIDELVEVALSSPGVVGSRMTGGGFGGCTITLVAPDAVDALRRTVEREYPARTGREPRTWNLQAVDGASLVTT